MDGFEAQLDALVAMYMQWVHDLGDKGLGAAIPPNLNSEAQGKYEVQVLDIFSEFELPSSAPHLSLKCRYRLLSPLCRLAAIRQYACLCVSAPRPGP